MNLDADILNEVIKMAQHGKTMQEISDYLNPDNQSEIMMEFSNKDSELFDAFRLGNSTMGPDIKLLSAKAEIETINLKRQMRANLMISDYLGETISDSI